MKWHFTVLFVVLLLVGMAAVLDTPTAQESQEREDEPDTQVDPQFPENYLQIWRLKSGNELHVADPERTRQSDVNVHPEAVSRYPILLAETDPTVEYKILEATPDPGVKYRTPVIDPMRTRVPRVGREPLILRQVPNESTPEAPAE